MLTDSTSLNIISGGTTCAFLSLSQWMGFASEETAQRPLSFSCKKPTSEFEISSFPNRSGLYCNDKSNLLLAKVPHIGCLLARPVTFQVTTTCHSGKFYWYTCTSRTCLSIATELCYITSQVIRSPTLHNIFLVHICQYP